MSVDPIVGVTGLTPAVPLSATTPAAGTPPAEPFTAVLQKHLDAPRRDIASVRSEIAAIRAGAPFFRGGGAGGVVGGGTDGGMEAGLLGGTSSTRTFTHMPGWLDAQLARQATGDTADPYGWRAMSRGIAEQTIGPGYGALFERQMAQESGFLPEVVYGLRVSSAGAEGIAQLMPQYYAHVDRLDPRAGLTAGAQTMRHYLDVWGGDVRRALASYNAGLGRVQQLVDAHGANWEAGLPQETRHYLQAILGEARPAFTALVSSGGAVFGGRGPGGVLTAPLSRLTAQRPAGAAVDFFGGAGDAVLAPADGVLVESAEGRVVLDHGNGWQSTLTGLLTQASAGASLLRGRQVGALDTTGLLRMGVTYQGRPVDASRYLLATA